MGVITSAISQAYPPKPKFTEKDIGNLAGKVYVVTGANTGLGKEVAQILYSKNAKVYCAARSKEKTLKAIDSIKANWPDSYGEAVFLQLDLADLSTIKVTVDDFLSKEDKLHALFNNAGVMLPPQGSKTAQGYELQLGVNNLGTFLLNKLLTPTLIRTAKSQEPSSVRVIWVASSAAEAPVTAKGGVDLSNLDYHVDKSAFYKYATSKAGNYLQGAEFARRHKEDGVVSVPLNPGNLDSDLWRNMNPGLLGFIKRLALYPPIMGAYTQLFAALSPEVTIERSGDWVVPWGRFMAIRKDLLSATKPVSENGTGVAERFWEWQEEQVRPFL